MVCVLCVVYVVLGVGGWGGNSVPDRRNSVNRRQTRPILAMGEESSTTQNVLSKALLGPANLRDESSRGSFLKALKERGTDPPAA